MYTSYFIFKTDNLSGKTIHICNGSHDSEYECNIHFHAYMYGFYDGCVEALGSGKFQFERNFSGLTAGKSSHTLRKRRSAS